jgi:hypothetical protein
MSISWLGGLTLGATGKPRHRPLRFSKSSNYLVDNR